MRNSHASNLPERIATEFFINAVVTRSQPVTNARHRRSLGSLGNRNEKPITDTQIHLSNISCRARETGGNRDLHAKKYVRPTGSPLTGF
jgi:hypothetical protein